ncbi:MAG: hypothetical protein QW303_02800 [Nitrososphaerota archaeon]
MITRPMIVAQPTLDSHVTSEDTGIMMARNVDTMKNVIPEQQMLNLDHHGEDFWIFKEPEYLNELKKQRAAFIDNHDIVEPLIDPVVIETKNNRPPIKGAGHSTFTRQHENGYIETIVAEHHDPRSHHFPTHHWKHPHVDEWNHYHVNKVH